ncbi:surface antigen S [BeAn 58058 virus]|uniref:surface antigen S n=1 Tax=BeAn 58058 virus TaxID=67082 RepID=UPI00090B29BE|nr:surface antigen S [BeAn 58058 virus]APG58394.1 surface antigen S [BeAn 58058 virus]
MFVRFHIVIPFIAVALCDFIDDHYNEELKKLSPDDIKLLDPKCKYGGIVPKVAVYTEPFSARCVVLDEFMLYFKYGLKRKNYTVEWNTFNKVRESVLDAEVVGKNLIIKNYTSDYDSHRYICKLTIPESDTCIESIMTSRAVRPVKYCISEKFEFGQRYEEYGVYLFCNSVHFKSYDRIVWFKDGKEIKYDNKKYFPKDMTLNIKDVTYQDAGEYVCNVEYDNRIVFNRCTNLLITPKQDHDYTIYAPNLLSVKIGEPANVSCTVVPKTNECVHMFWENEQEDIIGFDLNIFSVVADDDCNTSILYFENVTNKDIGTIYTCRASNVYVDKSTATKLVLAN